MCCNEKLEDLKFDLVYEKGEGMMLLYHVELLSTCPSPGIKWLLKRISKVTDKYISGLKLKSDKLP